MKQISIPAKFIEEQTKDASLYYSRAWLDLITTLYGHRIIPLLTTNQVGQVTGFLPLCLIRSPLTGRRLVALPYSDYCPLLASDDNTANELITRAIDLAHQYKVRYLELRAGPNEALAKRTDLVETDLCVRPLLSLPADSDVAWSRLRKPVQQQINKSRKLGVQVRIAQRREEVAHYYRLHLQTYSKKHGVPAQPAQFFYSLWDSFAANGTMQLLLAEYQGQTIAGMIIIVSGNKAVKCAYGASDKRYLYLAPNNLLMWTAITWGCEHDYRVLDMGRTARTNEGLMEYKRRWGAVPEPLPYYTYYPTATEQVGTSGQSRKMYFFSNCWKHLPVAITGPLGGCLYRHMT
jgi:hypothetical protein